MTYKLFITYPQITHKLIHSPGKQKSGDAFSVCTDWLVRWSGKLDQKTYPVFSTGFVPFIRSLYRAYPSLVRMLVHMFIHTQQYGENTGWGKWQDLSRVVSQLSTGLSTGIKKRRQPGQADGVMLTEGGALTS